jgi:hypothetical protein
VKLAKSNGVPEYARELVTRGLDTLAEKLSAAGERTPGAAKLAKMWSSLSDEERGQVGASIVAAATAAAAAIPMTIAAIRKRRATKSSDDVRKKKKDKKKKKKNKKH